MNWKAFQEQKDKSKDSRKPFLYSANVDLERIVFSQITETGERDKTLNYQYFEVNNYYSKYRI